ncbi:MAG: hypothetical protein BVN33_16735 [Proteobacteria bacterium ST_bin13]|nr:MAG: hypothetical protein BVN33_16735 [Proteobacteria bacterium ST_bin13]
MHVAVLVVIYCGKEHISLHENDAAGWLEVLRFVNERWTTRFPGAMLHRPESDDELVQLFFGEAGDSFMLGNADLSEVAAYVEAAIGGVE